MEVLLAFTPNNEELGTVEISKKLGFHPSTASRIVHTLTNYGFLQQNPLTNKFILGHASVNLGVAVQRALDTNITYIAKPHIDALRNRIKKTVVLVTRLGGDIISAYLSVSPGPINISGSIGEMRPMHATAGGKAILAFASPEMKESI